MIQSSISLLSELSTLQQSRVLTDTLLVGQDGRVMVHWAVLARWAFWRGLREEEDRGSVTIILPGVGREELENIVQNQSNLDDLWISVKNLLLNELDTIPDLPKSNQKKQNKQFRKSQPFWNRNLETAWRDVCRSENDYLMYKANSRCEIAQKKTT